MEGTFSNPTAAHDTAYSPAVTPTTSAPEASEATVMFKPSVGALETVYSKPTTRFPKSSSARH